MDILDFSFYVGRLKRLRRTGWVREGVPEPESVADHSYRVAILALVLAPRVPADPYKSVAMALIHDLAEGELGDQVTARSKVILAGAENKVRQEAEFTNQLLTGLARTDLAAIYQEYAAQQTPESRFVRELDRFDMAVQALEYEKDLQKTMQEFFDNTDQIITIPFLRQAFDRLIQMRSV